MKWIEHKDLSGKHAFLSPSDYHWLNYTEEKLIERYSRANAKLEGTRKHELASELIKMNVQVKETGDSFTAFVNDAINFKMSSEVTLYYSDNCFGTADAICFRNNKLRIHDLKTGITPASMKQLMIYAALFCMEYCKKPSKISIELRIYQNEQPDIYKPTAEEIEEVMATVINHDKIIKRNFKERGALDV